MKNKSLIFIFTLMMSSISNVAMSCSITNFNDLSTGMNNINPDCIIDTSSLMANRFGFAKNVYGGLTSSKVFLVTSLDDNGSGTLREGLSLGSSWIVFAVSGTINLESRLNVPSNITVDGRGASIRLENYGLYISDVSNVIIENLVIENGVANTMDAIEVNQSNLIWIDHTTLRNFPDGLLDIHSAPEAKTRVTLSWNRFENHGKTMIIGWHKMYANNDKNIYATIHHNYFAGTGERHPRLSQGYAHLYNNILLWNIIGAQSYDNGKLIMEGNFLATLDPTRLKATDYRLNDPLIPDGNLVAPLEGINANKIMGDNAIYVLENGIVYPPSYPYSVEQTSDCVYYKVALNAGFHFDAVSSLTESMNSPSISNSPLSCD